MCREVERATTNLVPDYLDNTDILTRSGSDEVKASATGRWGERLSLGLTRALRADLAARTPQYSGSGTFDSLNAAGTTWRAVTDWRVRCP